MTRSIIGAIEAGGTKIICALADGDGAILQQARIATRDPDSTFDAVASFFETHADTYGPVASGGIGSFGPLDLDHESTTFGCLTTTPKAGWAGVDMLGRVREILRAPVVIDTDVNCAALAETAHGAARGLDRVCYITIGTGIGVGIVEGGRTNAGAGHPEVGHISIARATGDAFPGICPSHGDCAEGLASGPAMQARWQQSAESLPDGHIGWDYEAQYIAAICLNLTYIVRPQRIVIGGGVMERLSLIAAVRETYRRLGGGYAMDRYSADTDTYLCTPQLREPSPGLVGAIDLARAALAASRRD